jgi:Pyridoxamine 5'-phosphate oxidase
MGEEPQTEHSEEIKTLVQGANFSHLATLMRDGAPHFDPVWIDLEGDTIPFVQGRARLRARTQSVIRVLDCLSSRWTILTRRPNSVAELSSSALIGTLP